MHSGTELSGQDNQQSANKDIVCRGMSALCPDQVALLIFYCMHMHKPLQSSSPLPRTKNEAGGGNSTTVDQEKMTKGNNLDHSCCQ